MKPTDGLFAAAMVTVGAVLALVVFLAVRNAWLMARALRDEVRALRAGAGREPQRLADDLPRVSAEADRARAADRVAAQQRFVDRRVGDLVTRGVPRAVAEQDAEQLWAAIDLGPI